MNERDYLAERFEEHRTHLRSVAYRMLGSAGEVDDAVQEVWLRLSRTDPAGIDNLGGWLTTVVARSASTRCARGSPGVKTRYNRRAGTGRDGKARAQPRK